MIGGKGLMPPPTPVAYLEGRVSCPPVAYLDGPVSLQYYPELKHKRSTAVFTDIIALPVTVADLHHTRLKSRMHCAIVQTNKLFDKSVLPCTHVAQQYAVLYSESAVYTVNVQLVVDIRSACVHSTIHSRWMIHSIH